MLLISTDSSDNGGISKFCRILQKHFNFEETVYLTKSENTPNKVYGVPPLYLFNPFPLISSIKKKQKIVLNDPQVTTITIFTLFLSFLFKNDIYFVSHGFLFHNNSSSWIKKIHFYFSIKFIFPYLNVVSVSDNDSAILKSYNYNDFIQINHGVNAPSLTPANDKFECIFVGRNVPHKNIPKYLSLCEELYKYNSSLSFLLVTDSTLDLMLPPCVVHLSNLDESELSNAYASSRFVISFSDYEGFGLSVIEGILHGCYPVVYANDSFSSIFFNFPDVVFTPNTVDNALSCVNKYDAVLHARIYEFVSSSYGVERMLSNYSALFKDQ